MSSSQHFSAWKVSWMRVWIRPQDLALARHVQISAKMSVVVYRSVSQSSNLEESCLLNIGISWSKDVVRLASLCVVHRVSMYACTAWVLLYAGGLGCGWIVIVRYNSLSVSCCNSSISVGGWVAGSKWVSQS